MILYILIGQRIEDYPGQYAPEALAVIDEYGHSDNPDYMREQKELYEKSKEFEKLAVIAVNASTNAIMEVLRPRATLIRSEFAGEVDIK